MECALCTSLYAGRTFALCQQLDAAVALEDLFALLIENRSLKRTGSNTSLTSDALGMVLDD